MSCESCENGGDRLPHRQIGDFLPGGQDLSLVRPDYPLVCATSIMLKNKYSQLPVVSHDDKLEGIITWELILKSASSGTACTSVHQCMEPFKKVNMARFDNDLLNSTTDIAEYGYVLVMGDDDRTVEGILTASDLADKFRGIAEGFLLIEGIENLLEKLTDDKPPKGHNALTYYYNCLKEQENFNQLGLDVCHETIRADLKSSKCIRNVIMHFDPGRPTDEDVDKLREFLRCLSNLQRV